MGKLKEKYINNMDSYEIEFSDSEYTYCNWFTNEINDSIKIKYSELFGKDERILISCWPDLLQLEMSETREGLHQGMVKRGNKIILNSFASLGFIILEEEGQEPKDH